MISAFNQWLCIPADKLEVIKRIVMLLHNASLLYVVPDCYLSVIAEPTP